MTILANLLLSSSLLLLLFVILIQSRVIQEEETLIDKMPPEFWPWTALWSIFLIDDGCGWTQPTMGRINPDTGGPGDVKKQIQQAMWIKPVTSVPP